MSQQHLFERLTSVAKPMLFGSNSSKRYINLSAKFLILIHTPVTDILSDPKSVTCKRNGLPSDARSEFVQLHQLKTSLFTHVINAARVWFVVSTVKAIICD